MGGEEVGPLSEITVVALEQAVAAPFATRQLADWGARVIKIERPGAGDFARHYDTTVRGQSSHFVWLNRSKESITVDLKQPEGADIIGRLVARADVFIQNLAPGAAERLGLSAAQLHARHPRLVACDLSGYGDSGPYRDRKAYDLLVQAEAGLLSITGVEDQPSRVGISVADIAGGMYALTGILTALYERERTGHGASFSVSLFDALGEWMSFPSYFTDYGGAAPKRSGAAHAAIAPYGPVPTADGASVMIGVQNEREWSAFCAVVIERPEIERDARFADNPSRVRNRAALDACVGETLGALPLAEVIARLDRAGIAHAQLNDVAGFVAHPQLAARERWREVATPNGTVRALVPPVTFAGHEPVMGAIPSIGEHTDALLEWLGFREEEIASLHANGVV